MERARSGARVTQAVLGPARPARAVGVAIICARQQVQKRPLTLPSPARKTLSNPSVPTNCGIRELASMLDSPCYGNPLDIRSSDFLLRGAQLGAPLRNSRSGLSPGRGQPRGRERVSAGLLPGVNLADSLRFSKIAITERKQARMCRRAHLDYPFLLDRDADHELDDRVIRAAVPAVADAQMQVPVPQLELHGEKAKVLDLPLGR